MNEVSIVVIVLIFIFAFVFSPDNQKNRGISENVLRKRYIIIICSILTLQSALRNVGVGADTYTYQMSFERTLSIHWDAIFKNFINVYVNKEGKDAGYNLLEKIFQLFSTEYRVFLFFIAIVFFTAFGRFLYKNTSRISDVMFAFVLYMALFYGFFSITGLRQTLATACALWGFEYIKQKKLWKFTLIILAAAFLHKSVLIFLPYYFIANIKKTRAIYFGVLLFLPFLFMLKDQIMHFIIITTGSYEEYLHGLKGAGTYTFTTLFLLVYIMGAIYIKKILKKHPESYRFYNALSIAVLFIPLTYIDPNAMRAVQYFSVFLMLFIPICIDSIAVQKNNRQIIFVIAITILIVLVIKTQGEYKFMWQEMPLDPNYIPDL